MGSPAIERQRIYSKVCKATSKTGASFISPVKLVRYHLETNGAATDILQTCVPLALPSRLANFFCQGGVEQGWDSRYCFYQS